MHLDHMKGFRVSTGVGLWLSEDMRAYFQIFTGALFFFYGCFIMVLSLSFFFPLFSPLFSPFFYSSQFLSVRLHDRE